MPCALYVLVTLSGGTVVQSKSSMSSGHYPTCSFPNSTEIPHIPSLPSSLGKIPQYCVNIQKSFSSAHVESTFPPLQHSVSICDAGLFLYHECLPQTINPCLEAFSLSLGICEHVPHNKQREPLCLAWFLPDLSVITVLIR